MKGYSHVAIGVRDMERSLRIYRDVLGLKVHRDAEEILPEMGVQAGPVQRDPDNKSVYNPTGPQAEKNDGGYRRTFRRRGVFLRWNDADPSFIVLSQRST